MRGLPLVVIALVAVNIAAFAIEAQAPDPDAVIGAFALVPYDVVNGIVLPPPSPPIPALTLVTAMFMHGGLLHLAFNMLFLVGFGREIEAMCGHGRFLALYLLCGLAGWIAQIAVNPGSHVPAIGASGAIAGILGASLVKIPRLPSILFIGVWAMSQFAHGFGALSSKVANDQGGTAYFAHIGGFCAGMLLIGTIANKELRTR